MSSINLKQSYHHFLTHLSHTSVAVKSHHPFSYCISKNIVKIFMYCVCESIHLQTLKKAIGERKQDEE